MNEHSDQVELTRSQLYKRVWSEPMVRLVKELGIFGVPKADIKGSGLRFFTHGKVKNRILLKKHPLLNP